MSPTLKLDPTLELLSALRSAVATRGAVMELQLTLVRELDANTFVLWRRRFLEKGARSSSFSGSGGGGGLCARLGLGEEEKTNGASFSSSSSSSSSRSLSQVSAIQEQLTPRVVGGVCSLETRPPVGFEAPRPPSFRGKHTTHNVGGGARAGRRRRAARGVPGALGGWSAAARQQRLHRHHAPLARRPNRAQAERIARSRRVRLKLSF